MGVRGVFLLVSPGGGRGVTREEEGARRRGGAGAMGGRGGWR